MKSRIIMIFAVILSIAPRAQAASFDCTKASTYAEKAICADARLSELDDQLAASFQISKQNSADPQSLINTQRNWLETRRDKCADSKCLKEAYSERIKELETVSAANEATPASDGKKRQSISQKDNFSVLAQTNQPTGDKEQDGTLKEGFPGALDIEGLDLTSDNYREKMKNCIGKFLKIKGYVVDYSENDGRMKVAYTKEGSLRKDFGYYVLNFQFHIEDVPSTPLLSTKIANKSSSIAAARKDKSRYVQLIVELSDGWGESYNGVFKSWADADLRESARMFAEEKRKEELAIIEKERKKRAEEEERERIAAEERKKEELARLERERIEAAQADERKKQEEAELEAQPPQILKGDVKQYIPGKNNLILRSGNYEYIINNAPNINFFIGSEVKLTIRRIHKPTPNGEIECDFVSYEPEFLKKNEEQISIYKKQYETIKSEISSLQEERNNKIKLLQETKGKLFTIIGKITDRAEDSITIWGKALPLGHDSQKFGVNYEDVNIVVLDPRKPYNPSYYNGVHAFLNKSSGTNAFGVQVPVWVYGRDPSEDTDFQRLEKEIKDIDSRIQELQSDKSYLHFSR